MDGAFYWPPIFSTVIGQELYADFDTLKAEREKCDRQIIEWSIHLDGDWLINPLSIPAM